MSAYEMGDRVRFLGFGEPDPYSRLRVGTKGTVATVDDLGTVHVDWDDGGRLGMVVVPPPGRPPDRIELIARRSFPESRDPVRPDGPGAAAAVSALIDNAAVAGGQDQWSAVDGYVTDLLAAHDSALDAALEASEKAGLPPIQVSQPQGKLLSILAAAIQAKTILEIGTLGGYSTIWLARALPEDGRLVTLEVNADYAAVARQNIERAGLGALVDLRIGPALDLLVGIAEEKVGSFDLVFIDADKPKSPGYFSWAVHHTRPGGLIVADNVVRGGALADAESEDAAVKAQRVLHEMMAAEERVSATTIQTVGSKGYDGFSLALVKP